MKSLFSPLFSLDHWVLGPPPQNPPEWMWRKDPDEVYARVDGDQS